MEVGKPRSPSHPVHRGTQGGSEFLYAGKTCVYMTRGKSASGSRVTRVVGSLGLRDRVTLPPK